MVTVVAYSLLSGLVSRMVTILDKQHILLSFYAELCNQPVAPAPVLDRS